MGSMSMGFKLQTINGLITAIVYCLEQKVLLDKLQSVWNADARLVAKLRQFDHITTTITYRCMHSTAPEYLTEMFMPVTDDPGRRHLRSAARGEWWHRCTTNKYQDEEVLLSTNQSSGTGFRPLSATLNCRWTVFVENWRHSISADLIVK